MGNGIRRALGLMCGQTSAIVAVAYCKVSAELLSADGVDAFKVLLDKV